MKIKQFMNRKRNIYENKMKQFMNTKSNNL